MHIKRIIPIIATLAFLVACSPLQPQVERVKGAPTYPPTQHVEFLNDKPSRPYQALATIDVEGTVGMYREQIIVSIRKEALQLGADAVILEDRSRRTPVESQVNPFTGRTEQVGGEIIPIYRGVAIKYQ